MAGGSRVRGFVRRDALSQQGVDFRRRPGTTEQEALDLVAAQCLQPIDLLRGLDYLRVAGAVPDERVAEAIDIVATRRDAAGRWPLENPHPGAVHFDMDEGEGRPSRWNTLRAMRVLRWWERPGV